MSFEKEQQDMVDDWNSKNAVGCKVLVRKDNGEEIETTTKHAAEISGGVAAGYVHGIRGLYRLARLRAMKPCAYCKHMLAEPFPFETGTGDAVCDDCGRERNM